MTVTHPDARRYFMTIPEAVQLVLQASSMGKGGEIFVLDMGEPVRILDLVRNLIRLSGLEPDRDIKIDFVGLRPGEKMFEELKLEGEDIKPTAHEKIRLLTGSRTDVRTGVELARRTLRTRGGEKRARPGHQAGDDRARVLAESRDYFAGRH